MPDPNKYKNEKEWMSDCMHTLLHVEKKDQDQAVAQCLNMWRQRKKKALKVINSYLKGAIDMNEQKNIEIVQRVLSAFLKRKSGRNPLPGQRIRTDKEIEKWKKNLDKKITPLLTPMKPYKKGEPVNILIEGKFVEVPWDPELLEQEFIYLDPKTREVKKQEPVHG